MASSPANTRRLNRAVSDLREKTKADDGPRQAEIGGEEHAGQRFRPIVWACERGHRADGALEHQAAADADDEHPGDEHGEAWLRQPYGNRQQPKSDQHRRHAARQERPGVPRPGKHLSDRGGRKHSERGCAGECARAVVQRSREEAGRERRQQAEQGKRDRRGGGRREESSARLGGNRYALGTVRRPWVSGRPCLGCAQDEQQRDRQHSDEHEEGDGHRMADPLREDARDEGARAEPSQVRGPRDNLAAPAVGVEFDEPCGRGRGDRADSEAAEDAGDEQPRHFRPQQEHHRGEQVQ